VFADGFEDGMKLAFSPAGELHLVTATAVWALHDRDRDGVSESRTQVLRLTRPAKVYDHAAPLGLTFSADGWLYVSAAIPEDRHGASRDPADPTSAATVTAATSCAAALTAAACRSSRRDSGIRST
jgi:hypothetical protein